MAEQYVLCGRLKANGDACRERTIPQTNSFGGVVMWCSVCRTETPVPRRHAAGTPTPLENPPGETTAEGPTVCSACLQERILGPAGLCSPCQKQFGLRPISD